MTIQKSDELGDLFCALSQLQGKIEMQKKISLDTKIIINMQI